MYLIEANQEQRIFCQWSSPVFFVFYVRMGASAPIPGPPCAQHLSLLSDGVADVLEAVGQRGVCGAETTMLFCSHTDCWRRDDDGFNHVGKNVHLHE